MYSNVKSVQMFFALLKKYGVKHVVMSPGGSDIPIIHSIENDSDFVCYSVVDERSAVYFGMGVAQETNSPVACVCTSGTAVSNYLPGMTEASFQNVPIVAITADKNPRYLGQLEIQKTNQINIFGDVCRKAVNLPIIQSTEDELYCERLIAETLVELTHKGTGPVHINIPIVENNAIYDVDTLPAVKDIQIIPAYATEDEWVRIQKELANFKRIMIVVGQNVHYSKELIKNIEMFYKHYNCMISVESLSNLDCNGTIHTYPITEMKKGNLTQNLVPDLVISIGNNIVSYGLKPFLRKHRKEFKHWAVDNEGRIRDVFNSLTKVFECPEFIFFSKMNKLAQEATRNDGLYYNIWKRLYDKIVQSDLNPNSCILGMPGSGKSFAAKREMINVLLNTDDEIYVIDPEREYLPLVDAFGGACVKISNGSDVYINPFDMDLENADDAGDPIKVKSDFIGSLCEIMIGGNMGLTSGELSIIGRSVINVYEPY